MIKLQGVNVLGPYKKWSDEFRQARRIGASDWATILGMNPYKTPLELYNEIKGIRKPFAGNDATKYGQEREPHIIAWFADQFEAETGTRVDVFPYVEGEEQYTLQHEEYPFMTCQPDAYVGHPQFGLCLMECKTANHHAAIQWYGDQVPRNYYAQVQAQMFITKLPVCYVAAELGTSDVRVIRTVDIDEQFLEWAVPQIVNFWSAVELGIEPQATAQDYDWFLSQHPAGNGNFRTLEPGADTEVIQVLSELGALKEQIKELKEREDTLKAKLVAAIGDDRGVKTSVWKADWRDSTSKKFDRKGFDLAYPNVYEMFQTEEKTRALYVTRVKGE